MWIHNINPTIVDLGPVEIRWYGLVYVLGFFVSVWWLHYLKNKGELQFTSDEIWDFVFYLMVGVLIGSRLFMIFWQPDIYLFKPWNLLKIWEGGMSFHGGLVGIVTAAAWYCKKKQWNFWKMADIMSIPTMFALTLGRVANFINGELVGRVWNGRWCVNFKNTGGGDVCRHPSTLYAAGARFIVLLWLGVLMFWKQFSPGFIFWNFVFWEGIGRFLVDFYREDPLFWGLSLGQWFSVIMILVAGWMFWKRHRNDWKKIFSRKNINSK